MDFYNFGTKPIKIKQPKIKPPKIQKLYMTKAGDRTLTPAQKRKLKEATGYRCSICGKKFDGRLLEIHHKKGVAKHKNPMGFDMPVMARGKKHIPVYDRRKSNLQVVCIYCHDKTKKKAKKKNGLYYGDLKW